MYLKIYIITFFSIALLLSCNNSNSTNSKINPDEIKKDSTQTAIVYQCPMDCEKGKTYDQPGKCPVCKMDLEKKE